MMAHRMARCGWASPGALEKDQGSTARGPRCGRWHDLDRKGGGKVLWYCLEQCQGVQASPGLTVYDGHRFCGVPWRMY